MEHGWEKPIFWVVGRLPQSPYLPLPLGETQNNIPSWLSPQWLYGKLCTWTSWRYCGDNLEGTLFSWLAIYIYRNKWSTIVIYHSHLFPYIKCSLRVLNNLLIYIYIYIYIYIQLVLNNYILYIYFLYMSSLQFKNHLTHGYMEICSSTKYFLSLFWYWNLILIQSEFHLSAAVTKRYQCTQQGV